MIAPSKELYKCSHPKCGAVRRIAEYCSACGRNREHPRHVVHTIPAPQSKFFCKACLSESSLMNWCNQCGGGMTETFIVKWNGHEQRVELGVWYPGKNTPPPERKPKPIKGLRVKTAPPLKHPVPEKVTLCSQYGYHSGCIVPGCYEPTRSHHIVPKRHGGSDGISNRMAICERHEYHVHLAGRVARMMQHGVMTAWTANSLKKLPNYHEAWLDGMTIGKGKPYMYPYDVDRAVEKKFKEKEAA